MGKNVKINSWEFDGIRVRHAITTFEELSGFTAHQDNEYVRLHFGLRGDYSFHYGQLDRSFDLIGGHHNLMYSRGIDLEVHTKELLLETFGVDFPREQFLEFVGAEDEFLGKFCNDVAGGKDAILSPVWGTVDITIQSVIDEILLNHYQGRLKEIFLLAKSLELLVLCIDNYKVMADQSSNHLRTAHDKEKIIAARDYINERITVPPSLSQIAKAVGINEFKLKCGFKEMFRTTTFAYLTERRLQRAMYYLKETDKTASEISRELGYSSPQHFNHQFRKKFGITPNSVRKNP